MIPSSFADAVHDSEHVLYERTMHNGDPAPSNVHGAKIAQHRMEADFLIVPIPLRR